MCTTQLYVTAHERTPIENTTSPAFPASLFMHVLRAANWSLSETLLLMLFARNDKRDMPRELLGEGGR